MQGGGWQEREGEEGARTKKGPTKRIQMEQTCPERKTDAVCTSHLQCVRVCIPDTYSFL